MINCGNAQCGFGGGGNDLYCGECYRRAVAEREALRKELGADSANSVDVRMFGVWVPRLESPKCAGQMIGGYWLSSGPVFTTPVFTTEKMRTAAAEAFNTRFQAKETQSVREHWDPNWKGYDPQCEACWAEIGRDGQPIFHDNK